MIDRTDETRVGEEHVVDRFRAERRADADLTIGAFLKSNPSHDRDRFLVPLVLVEMQLRAPRSEPRDPSEYFREFPELATHADSWRLLEAARSRLERRDGPRWLEAWRELAPAAYRYFSAGEGSGDPSPTDLRRLQEGDEVLGFEVTDYLGAGAYGRVYRAIDRGLQREVALKIGEAHGSEGRALARLDHPNIVPVYGEHLIHGSRVLVMRYLPGGTLADWVRLRHAPSADASEANAFAAERPDYRRWAREAAAGLGEPAAEASPSSGEPPTPEHGSEAHVAVWIVCKLAQALQHAHGRGVLHLDIKPANVLIDTSGAPLLSDFNVAALVGEGGTKLIGGTLSYMSPEQLRAYCADEGNAASRIDTRSDLYSLGVVLLELLTGEKNWTRVEADDSELAARQLFAARVKSGPPSVAGRDGVDRTLAAIVDKALRPATDERYQSAADFATDLTRWLDGRGNAYAPNPSRREFVGRWLRRRRVPVSAVLAATLAACFGFYAWVATERRDLAACDQLLAEAASSLEAGDSPAAAERIGQAQAGYRRLVTTRWFAGGRHAGVGRRLQETSKRVRDREASRFVSLLGRASLHTIHAGGPTDGSDLIEDGLRVYGALSHDDWQRREPFAGLPAEQKKIVSENVTELMLISIVKSIETSRPTERQWRAVLSRVPSEHRSYGVFGKLKDRSPGGLDPESADAPSDPFECYLWGVVAETRSEKPAAYRWYNLAVKLRRPGEVERFWLRYRLGIACQQLGRHPEACVHYGVCLGLRPDFAWPHFNLGLACFEADDAEHATRHLRRAIHLDGEFTAAYVALGTIELERGNRDAALRACAAAEQAGLRSDELTALRARLVSLPKANDP